MHIGKDFFKPGCKPGLLPEKLVMIGDGLKLLPKVKFQLYLSLDKDSDLRSPVWTPGLWLTNGQEGDDFCVTFDDPLLAAVVPIKKVTLDLDFLFQNPTVEDYNNDVMELINELVANLLIINGLKLEIELNGSTGDLDLPPTLEFALEFGAWSASVDVLSEQVEHFISLTD